MSLHRLLCVLALLAGMMAAGAVAGEVSEDDVAEIQETLARQQKQLEEQQKQLAEQSRELEKLRRRQPEEEEEEGESSSVFGRLGNRVSVSGYGVINYYHFDWETDPARRDGFDIERMVLEAELDLGRGFEIESEIEFEHAGTGATLEFDRFEEFGEFEQEIEAGGEVVLEKLFVSYRRGESLGFRAGYIVVPVGLVSKRHQPSDYFTTTRSEAELGLLPTIWREAGVEVFGRVGKLRYQLLLVNGLDSTAFSSANWVQRGMQKRFELINAENFAGAVRLDYEPVEGLLLGVAGYLGDSADNRPKPDLDVSAVVGIADLHATVERGPFRARGLVLYGHLQNADRVSQANRNLSNNLNVKRTPVASEALAWYVETGYDVLSLLGRPGDDPDGAVRLFPFARYDFYDSMYDTTGEIFDNPRWERKTLTLGVNFHPHPQLVFKGQISFREVGIPEENQENSLSFGLGYEF